ncbi:ROK family protein [Bacillus salacetis]|uniref:ROK family protein n=1 Tax=Bacillus salacetis TaxID=2315464 RepID=A0A3A1R4Z3_9BACI|nr:ROK family protein [Bacillus salacetis]RIW34254.1 ROK family protein [Bacillus salacetis]
MSIKIGIDLGGTNVRAAIVETDGAVSKIIQESTEAELGYAHTVDKMFRMVEELSGGELISGIGIGSPGPLDPKRGIILSPPNLPGWDDVPLVQMFKERLRTDVKLNNDANVAALAEARAGSGKGSSSVFYITISTGIGGGLVIHDQIFNGAQGYAGEVGNMIIQPGGYRHANLNRGSWEGHASGTAIGRIGRERLGITGGAEEVFRLAENGNAEAQAIIEETVDYLAAGIANIAHTINPEVFVLGGGVMKSEKLVLHLLREKVKEYLYPELARTIDIRPALLGGNAGVIGASLLIE